MGDKKDCGKANFRYSLITGMITAIFLVASLFAVYSVPVVNANDEGGGSNKTIYVPGDYPTIQQAIYAATDGDTIIVANGTYNEQLIINKNNLSIQSEYGAANTIINVTGQGTSYGGIVFKADGCTFEGFTVIDYSDEDFENKIIRIEGNNNTIKNNIIRGNLNQPGISNQTEYGILFQSTASGNLIENNEIYDIGYIGINIYGDEGARNNTVRNNYLHDIGIYAIAVDRSPNNTITQNTISNLVGGTLNLFGGGNYYYDSNTWCWGIVVWGANSAGTLITQQNMTNLPNGIVLSSAQNVTIENCNISNNGNYGLKIGYTGWIGNIPENNTIMGNTICNNKVGIYIAAGTGSIGPFNIIRYNNIYGNMEIGLNNTSPTLIDAEYNYWGDTTGPYHANGNWGDGDNVSDNVDYCPWLLNPYPQPTNVSSFNITQADFNMTGFSSNPDGNPSTPTSPSSGPDYLNITSVVGTYNVDIPPAGVRYVVVISGWLEADFDEDGTWDTHFDFFENIGPRTSPGPSTSWVGSMPFTVTYNGQSFDLIAQYDIDVNGSYPSDSFGDNAHANFTISGSDIMTFNAMLAYMDNISGGDDGYIDGLVRGNISISCIPLGCPVKNINTGKCYCAIQSAIDNATDGDTIIVGPGIYKESLTINKSLKIIGDPVIDAHGSKYGVQIQANHTLIENFTIYNYTEIGVYIYNDSFTLQNVTVNNCTICNSTYNTGSRGIELNDAKNVSISNCHISNNSEIGIYILRSENCKLENNTISNSEYGFKLSTSSKYNSLLNNTLVKNEQGICLLKSSSRNKLANNNISTSYYGIYVKTSYNQILNNTLLCNGGEGIYLESAKNNLVENNTISGGYYGMHLYKSDNNVLSNNTVNNTLLYSDKAIYLESANSNLIDNNTISGGHQGIYLYKSDENTLYNNTIKSNRYCGILVSHSNENVIDNNTIIDGVDGIYLDNSEKNSITNNSISNIQNGIWLSSSNENRISDNLLSGITWDIYVLDSEENLISNNTFSASYPTTASLRYKGNFAIRGINDPPENPDGFDDIGSFLNISSLSDESTWINLSIRYNENNVIINEDYLLIWMYNETGWHKEGWNETRYLDTTKNIIGVNITNPEGIFAPLQDIQPPVSTKTIGDPNCTIGGEDWITRCTPVWLDAEDNINGAGVDAIYYRIWYNESWHPADSQDSYGGNHNITMYNEIYWYVYSNDTVKFGPIYFMEEGKHYIEFFSTDRAGNEETHTNQTIYVDDTPPQVIMEMGIPHYIQDESIFINSSTSIWINVTDMMNLYIINWTIWNETGAVYRSGISEENLTLYIAEEGKYTIGYWAEDGLGNRRPASGHNNTTVYVDNTPPETDLTIGKPNHTKNNTLFVTARTPFNLSSEDGGKYPVGTEKICYRVWNIYTGWSDWKIYFANITLDEEGLHYIEYYAEDHLGNRGDIHNITCYVDDVPPITTGEGYYPIYLRTIDPGWDECPGVGVYCIHYRYKIGDGDWSDWFVNETDENLTLWIPSPSVSPGGEPIHLEYYSEDLLGNREDINYGVFTREINHPPLKPSNPSPANNSEDVPINPVLSVYVSDPDNDPLDVYFYNADNNDLIGSVKNVPSDSTVTMEWKNLERNRTYSWYVVVNDSEYSTKSDTWYFKTTSKNLAPYVKLIKPADAVYLLDKEIMPFLLPIIFGKITIEVNATDSDGTIEKVEFYVDNVLRSTDTAEPYTWTWDERIIGLHKITVIAYDDCGETAKTSRSLLIFNLKIL